MGDTSDSNAGRPQDNFHSPVNHAFYFGFSYGELSRTHRQIRLLKLIRSDETGVTHWTLVRNVDLSSWRGRYFALSYCAGDPAKTSKIIVDGVSFNAFYNLARALFDVTIFWQHEFPDRENFLWADQICINQSNFPERSHQVGFMDDIYRGAESVLVSIAMRNDIKPGLATPLAMLELISNLIKDNKSELTILDSQPDKKRLVDVIKSLCSNTPAGLITIWDVLEHPWWTRAWVYQEFILSPRAHFMDGKVSMPWASLGPILLALSSLSASTLETSLNNSIFPKSATFKTNIRSVVLRARQVEQRSEAVQNIIQHKAQTSKSTDLKILLRHARNCQASDKRDLVYAFLAVAGPGYGITPDYGPSNSITNVFMNTAEKIVLHDDNLDILLDAVGARGTTAIELPSWVPDWACKETSTSPKIDISGRKSHYNTLAWPFGTKGSVSVCDGVLIAQGCLWGTLDSLMQDPYGTWKDFVVSTGDQCHTSSLALIGDEIWLLKGAPAVFVLRKENYAHFVVSEAIVTIVGEESRKRIDSFFSSGEIPLVNVSII
jgi:hypothetical protein